VGSGALKFAKRMKRNVSLEEIDENITQLAALLADPVLSTGWNGSRSEGIS
jgi:hypothetical protein